jgi:hypothetical protein
MNKNIMEYDLEFCDFLFQFLNLNNSCLSNTKMFANISMNNNNKNNNTSMNIMFFVDLCYKIESHLIYLYWLLNFFSPLLKFIFILFLLPSILVIFIYATSFFLLFKKHWSRLKVGFCIFFYVFFCCCF